MKPKKLIKASLALVLVFAFAEVFSSTLALSSQKAQSTAVDIRIPALSLQVEGPFDLRDAQNRPIQSSAAQVQMRQLFVNSLFALLMSPELPSVAQALAVLESLWTAFQGSLFHAFGGAWQGAVDVWTPSGKRKFEFAGLLLAFSFLVAFFSQMLRRAPYSPRLTLQSNCLSSVVLRC